MAKPEWGTKRTCQSCGAKFYDMRRADPVCPKCGAAWTEVVAKPARRTRAAAPEPKVAVVEPESAKPEVPAAAAPSDAVEDIDDKIESDEEEDNDLIEDPSELGEDEDDMAEVVVEKEKEES